MTNVEPVTREQPTYVLVAEDSPTQALELSILLEDRGYTVRIARNGREALDAARERIPDLIISDIVMPEMDGYTLCKAIKADSELSQIPIILVTELSSPSNVMRGLDAGADNFVIKPYKAESLVSRIHYLLTNRSLRRESRLQMGIEIELSGQRHFINAERQQILDLLISTYEQAVDLNDELEQRQSELSRSFDTLNALYELAEGLNRCRTEDDVVGIAVARGAGLPGIRASWLYLKRAERFELAGSSGPLSEFITDAAARRDCECLRGVVKGDLSGPRNVGLCERLSLADNPKGLSHHASVPLMSQGEPIGLLNLVAEIGRRFSDDELRTLGAVGNHIAIAIERARLQSDLEQKVEERTQNLETEVRERREAEANAKSRSEELATIIDSSPVAIITVDGNCIAGSWNKAAEAMFGHTAATVVGHRIPMISDETLPDFDRIFELIRRGRILRNLKAKLPTHEGNYIDVVITAAPFKDNMRRFRGGVLVIEDVTERLRIEERLHHSQKMEAIGNLTGGIAHDFNNILTIIIGNLDRAGELNGEPLLKECLGTALGASLRGAELTRQLLAFGRRQALDTRIVNVDSLVTSAIALLGRTLGESVTIVRSDSTAELWPVEVDPTQLESALVNLAVNARDAMAGSGTLTFGLRNTMVDLHYARSVPGLAQGEYVLIEVSDTGSGISPDILSRIFEPFFTTKSENKGTGLGLAMVYGFVKQSRGHISVYSEVGSGTTFRIYLPRADGFGIIENMEEIDGDLDLNGHGEVILVVEDNVDVRNLVQIQLERLGYTAIMAESPDDALDILKDRGDVDLLFTDVVMPGEWNGLELGWEAIRRHPGLKVLLTSGYPEAVVNDANGSTSFRILGKPYRRTTLRDTLREVLNTEGRGRSNG